MWSEKENPLYAAIQEAFQSDLVGQYLIAKYSEAFIPTKGNLCRNRNKQDMVKKEECVKTVSKMWVWTAEAGLQSKGLLGSYLPPWPSPPLQKKGPTASPG